MSTLTRVEETTSYIASHNGSDMAFPCDGPNERAFGLTKREYIATHALAGILAHHNDLTYESVVRDAVKYADMVLKELAK